MVGPSFIRPNQKMLPPSKTPFGRNGSASKQWLKTNRPGFKAEDYWLVQYEVYRAILDRFRERKIEIPYPTREVRILGQTN